MSQLILQVAAKAVIVHKDKVLVVREAANHDTNTKAGQYQIVGGRLDPGESFQDGLKREVLEETGLTITYDRPLDIGEWRPVIKGVPHQIIAIFTVCHTDSDKVVLSDEHDDYKWINPKDFATENIMTPDWEVIKKYNEAKK